MPNLNRREALRALAAMPFAGLIPIWEIGIPMADARLLTTRTVSAEFICKLYRLGTLTPNDVRRMGLCR